jgi:hypothetical protein
MANERSVEAPDLVFANEAGGLLDLKHATARHFKPLLSA